MEGGSKLWTHFATQIWPPPFFADLDISCDAGARSWGAILNQDLKAHGFFPDHLTHSTSDSTLRELWGLHLSIRPFSSFLRNKSVQIFTDSQNAVSVISKGSAKPELNNLAREIASLTSSLNMNLLPTWIPRSANQAADNLTHWEDGLDWTISVHYLEIITKRLGMPNFDRFASHSNNLFDNFKSLFWCPNTSGINAFARSNCHTFFSRCNPPRHSIPKVIPQSNISELMLSFLFHSG